MSIASAVKDFGKVALVASAGLGALAGCSPSQKITPTNRGTVIGGSLGLLGGALIAQGSDSSLVRGVAPAAGAILGAALGGPFNAQCEATPSGYVSEGSGRRPAWEHDTEIDCNPVGGTMADFNMDPRVPPDTGRRRNMPVVYQQPQQQQIYQPGQITQRSLDQSQNPNGTFWSNGACQMEVFDGRTITVAPEACGG